MSEGQNLNVRMVVMGTGDALRGFNPLRHRIEALCMKALEIRQEYTDSLARWEDDGGFTQTEPFPFWPTWKFLQRLKNEDDDGPTLFAQQYMGGFDYAAPGAESYTARNELKGSHRGNVFDVDGAIADRGRRSQFYKDFFFSKDRDA